MDHHLLLRVLQKRFQSADWNPRQCSLLDIQNRFAEHKRELQKHGITAVAFDTLYRRTACESITEGWQETRAQEKGEAAAIATREGLLFCLFCFLYLILFFSLTFFVFLQKQPITTTCPAYFLMGW